MYVNGQKFESTIVLPYLTNKHLVYLGRHVNRDGDNDSAPPHFVGATGTYFDMLVLKNKYLTDDEMIDLQKKVNNIVVAEYYNPFGLTTMSSIKSDDAGEEILYHSYEYEKDNEKLIPRVNKETIRYKGNNSRELGYEYDSGNRLIKRNDFNGNTYNYKYNYRNCLIEEKINGSILNNVIYKYSYDNNGNILTKSGTVNKLYEYNGCKLVNIYNFGNEEIDESKKGTVAYESISYDGYYPTKVKKYNKNKTLTKSIEYIWRGNKLIQYKNITNSIDVRYEYNSNGLRSKKTVTSGIDSNKTTSETTYVYDGTCLIYECEKKDNVIVSEIYYLYSNKELIGYKKNNEKYYYVKDQTGNISAIIDSAGNFINKYSYDAYGRVIYCLHLNNNGKMRFKGYYYDDETELYWIDSRCYNPKWGRFIQPIGVSSLNISDINGLNLYSYVRNNPISYVLATINGGINNFYNFVLNEGKTVDVFSLGSSSLIANDAIYPSQESKCVTMTHYASSIMGDSYFGNAMGLVLGNFSKTSTIRNTSVNGFYSFSNLGNSGNSYGIGLNLNGYLGYSMYITDRIGVGNGASIGNFNFGAEVSVLDGISFSVGFSDGNVSTDYSVSIGWGTLAGAYVVATGMAALPIPGARVVAGFTAIVIILIDIFN